MTKAINYTFKAISYIIMLVAAVFVILIWSKGDSAFEGNLGLQNQILDPYMITAYIALGLAVLVTVIFSIVSIALNPKNAVKIVGILVGLVILGFITYSLAGNKFNAVKLQELETTVEVSKSVGAALYYTYIVGAVAILVTLYSSVAGLFKR